MKRLLFLLLPILVFSCTAVRLDIPVRTKLVVETMPPLPDNAELTFINLYEKLPDNSRFLSKLEVGGGGGWAACSYDLVIAEIELQARQVGANIIKVIKPDREWDLSVCPRLTVGLFHNDSPEALAAYQKAHEEVNASSLSADANYAAIHLYRPADPNSSLLVFPVFHDKSPIGRLGTNRKFTYQTTKFGTQRLYIGNSPFPFELDIQPGEEYYLKYSPSTGGEEEVAGLRLVDNIVGREETETIRPYVPRSARSSR